MQATFAARPEAAEHIPYYGQYIALVPDGDICAILERQIAETAAIVAGATPEQAQARSATGEWNAAEIVGHLADTERVFSYRALRIARADPLPWTPAELEIYVPNGAFTDRPLAGIMDDYRAVRAATLTLLRGLPAAAWEQRAGGANANETWTINSARAIAWVLAGHELHHRPDLAALCG